MRTSSLASDLYSDFIIVVSQNQPDVGRSFAIGIECSADSDACLCGSIIQEDTSFTPYPSYSRVCICGRELVALWHGKDLPVTRTRTSSLWVKLEKPTRSRPRPGGPGRARLWISVAVTGDRCQSVDCGSTWTSRTCQSLGHHVGESKLENSEPVGGRSHSCPDSEAAPWLTCTAAAGGGPSCRQWFNL